MAVSSEKKSSPAVHQRLVNYEQLEEWQKDNEHIRTGYVPANGSLCAVAGSLTYCHNETGNIYTHLIPSLAVLALLLYAVWTDVWEMLVQPFLPRLGNPTSKLGMRDTLKEQIYSTLQSLGITIGHKVTPVAVGHTGPFYLFALGCISCLGMSATFHSLKSHSSTVAKFGNKLDYFGICLLIATSMISLLEFAYSDMIGFRITFVSITAALSVACSTVSLLEKFRAPAYRPVRAGIFVAYGLSGVLPIVTGALELGYDAVNVRAACPWLYSEAFFYILGAVLYAARVPERLAPGKFDYIGHSHQIFHVFVFVAAYCHYRALCGAQAAALLRHTPSYIQ